MSSKFPAHIIEVTHALNGTKYLIDVDLIIGAGFDAKTQSTFLLSFTGPIMPIVETREFVMKHKKENNNGRIHKRSKGSSKKL